MPRHGGHDLVGLRREHVEVVAEELDREVGAHAGDQLVDAQLDRLAEAEREARDAVERPRVICASSSALRPRALPLARAASA